jgi:hypothetical protein
MKVEFKVESGHLRRDGPVIDAAIEKYTSNLWPFGRKEKAHKKLVKKEEEIIEEHGIEKNEELNDTFLIIKDVESEDEAREAIESFKEDLHELYLEEFDLDVPPIELSTRSKYEG